MKIRYDARADAAYITFKDTVEQVRTVRLTEDIAIDYGTGEDIYGIEILSASEHLGFTPDSPAVVLENLTARAAR